MLEAHTPGVTSSGRTEVQSIPVTSLTCMAAIGVSPSKDMRAAGSTFDSTVPPVALNTANCRAASQLIGPCPASIRERSPNNGSPEKGSSGVGSGGSAIEGMLRGLRASVPSG